MTSQRRSSRLIVLTVAFAVLVGACTSEGEEDPTETSAATDDQAVELTMTVWTADEDVIGAYEAMGDEFAQNDPRMSGLSVQSIPFNNYLGRLTTQLSGGDAPDIGWLVESNIPALAEAGGLVDLGDTLRNYEGYDFDDIIPGTLTGVARGDAVYGYPFANTTQPIVVNVDLFTEAGVDNPVDLYESGEWTWDNLARVAQELVDSGAAEYGFDIPQFQYNAYALLTPFLKAFGAEAWPGGTSCGYNSPEAVQAIEFLREMIFVDDSFPAPGETASFPTGNTGMYLGPPSTLNQLTEADFAFDVLPQPEGVNGFDPFFGQAALVAFSSGNNVDLASDFLAFVTTEENSRLLTQFFISPRTALLTPEIVSEANPMLTPEAAQRSLIDPLPEAEQLDFPPLLPELDSAIAPVMDQLWLPDADVESILNEVCEVAEPILADQ